MRLLSCLIAVALAVPVWAGTDVFGLAAEGRWEAVLDVVEVQVRQMPLSSGEALVAGCAAMAVGDPRASEFLRGAIAEDGPGQIAALKLAETAATGNPDESVMLALPLVRGGETGEVRSAAVEVVRRGVAEDVTETTRRHVREALGRMRRPHRRLLEATLAATAGVEGRSSLEQVLRRETGDRAAMVAAQGLEMLEPLTAEQQWLVAQADFDHGLYAEAEKRLGPLERAGNGGPSWEVAFLLGRCAFRSERWAEAAGWYRVSLERARGAKRRADLRTHLARALELGNDLEGAVGAARRALHDRATDGRRLFVARLLLKNGDRGAADALVERCRATANRDRGRVLLALDDLQSGRSDEAMLVLGRLKSRSWAPVGRVLAASMLVDSGAFEAALAELRSAVRTGVSPFWELSARRTAARLPDSVVAAWRREVGRARQGADGRESIKLLAECAVLDPDPSSVEEVRSAIGRRLAPRDGGESAPTEGLAGALWSLGLRREAARWDPSGFGRDGPTEAAWSAVTLNRLGAVDRGMVLADEVRRRLWARAPVGLLPRSVLRALYPLPLPSTTRSVAREVGVAWELLAALVREESRWDAEAVSAVGARGLTQLMPGTAARVARSEAERLVDDEALFEPETALRLGGREVSRLLRAFGGQAEPAVAAYNAGEGPVRLWAASCPHPCGSEMFVATIGYSATRLYVADVVASAEKYRQLYGANGASGLGAQSR